MIHPTAVVSPEAKIGRNVEIGPYAVIEDNVTIGDGVFIDSHVKICRYTTVGDNSRFYMGSLVGEEPQDHRMVPGIKSYTEIGANVILREYVTVHRSPFENGLTSIGDGTLLMAFVHVGHDARIGKNVTCANHTAISGHVQIGDGAVLSGYIMVHQFCRIGELAMISPGLKVRQDAPPFTLISEKGCVYGPNVVGLRRAGMSADERSAIKKTIKIFFFKGLNVSNAEKEMQSADFKNQYTDHFCKFMTSNERGILPPDPEMLAIGTRVHMEDDEN